jgi:hypothetical protein
MTSHTPGPWGIRTKQNLTAICTPKGEMQLSLHGVYDGLKPLSVSLQEWCANAALIAAAPEMLEALKDCVQALLRCTNVPGDFHIACISQAQTVINKAEGGVK